MTPQGIGLVARQEIRTRLRTGRWKALLVVWAVLVNGLAMMFRLALEMDDQSDFGHSGVPMFGGVLLAVLILTLLVTPALGAQAINGERERGTLAALQLTRLQPGDIVLGKLLAGWGTGLIVLLLTLPSLLLPVAEGAIGIGRAIVVLLVTGLLIGVSCALALGWSALLARSITAVLMSYLTVFGLLVGTPLLFTIALPFTAAPTGSGYDRDHPERVWWMLAPNPVVVLADAAPRLTRRTVQTPHGTFTESPPNDPLGGISREVRDIREGDKGYIDRNDRDEDAGPVWPYGLAFDLALAGGALWLSARRLRTPMYHVPRGVRVA
ncbi:ABC transporter permease [Spirillospora albida]|uniref:ABC transporter permease n=1 Tax=Spirillospora albida TaxID=58123 RepID=UPI0004BFF975|nr:ABC transporter permease [Spirillospora albida]